MTYTYVVEKDPLQIVLQNDDNYNQEKINSKWVKRITIVIVNKNRTYWKNLIQLNTKILSASMVEFKSRSINRRVWKIIKKG